MAFSLDPAALIGNAIQGAIGAPILIGLPSPTAKIPNFVIGIMPEEQVQTSVALPAFQLTAGDLFMKSAIQPGEYTFRFVLSQDPMLNAEWLSTVATAVQAFSGVAGQIANFGAVLPNLSGVSSNYAVSQLSTLRNIKNGMQPVLLLNAFIPLGSVSQNNPFLSSEWYIETIDVVREEAEGGGVVEVTLKELLRKRNPSLTSPGAILTNFANETIGPGAGSSLGALI